MLIVCRPPGRKRGLPRLSRGEAADAGGLGSVPGLGRSPGEGNGNSLQDFCLENSMDRGAWRATVHGVAKSQTRLSNFTSLPLLLLLKPTALGSSSFILPLQYLSCAHVCSFHNLKYFSCNHQRTHCFKKSLSVYSLNK